MKKIKLPEDYAIVLRLLKVRGRENFTSLAETLRFDRARLLHIIENLQHKGLILASRNTYDDAWIRLTAKGQRVMRAMGAPMLATGLS